jgi:hypothetical protein
MAAKKRRDLADPLARQTDRHTTAFHTCYGEPVKLSYQTLRHSRLKQTSAHASSTNAKNRSEPRSHRTVRRR